MSKTFQGRILIKGTAKGKASVSKEVFDWVEAVSLKALKKAEPLFCDDRSNASMHQKPLSKAILCAPDIKGKMIGDLLFMETVKKGIAPAAILLAQTAGDDLVGAIAASSIYSDTVPTVIDQLGDEFLEAIKTGIDIEIEEKSGNVIVG